MSDKRESLTIENPPCPAMARQVPAVPPHSLECAEVSPLQLYAAAVRILGASCGGNCNRQPSCFIRGKLSTGERKELELKERRELCASAEGNPGHFLNVWAKRIVFEAQLKAAIEGRQHFVGKSGSKLVELLDGIKCEHEQAIEANFAHSKKIASVTGPALKQLDCLRRQPTDSKQCGPLRAKIITSIEKLEELRGPIPGHVKRAAELPPIPEWLP